MTSGRFLLGLIGSNIMKSLSPAMQEDALAAAGLSGHYHLMDLDRLTGRTLADVFNAAKAVGFKGFNVTFPVKQAVMPLLDQISLGAQQIGAVNTVTIGDDGRTHGHNTDRIGFLRGFEEGLGHACIQGKPVLLIGAGGAGRAVAFALMDLGASDLVIHDVDPNRAAALTADITKHYRDARCTVTSGLPGDLVAHAHAAVGIVNATPIGMIGSLGIPAPPDAILPTHWVADIIYTPLQTEFIRLARSTGAKVLTADGMSVHQATEAFRLFTGQAADVTRMRQTFMSALAKRDEALARNQ